MDVTFTCFWYCVKSVQIRSFFWFVFSCIQSPNTGKYGAEKTRYLSTFHAVWATCCRSYKTIIYLPNLLFYLRFVSKTFTIHKTAEDPDRKKKKKKIRDSHLKSKVANTCLNAPEWVEVLEWNKTWSPPFPCCPVNRQCL